MSAPSDATRRDALLELRQVAKRYTTPDQGSISILEGIDLTLHAGEIVAILGRSGCGKSTLLRILCGLIPASAGAVLYRGQPVTRPEPRISMVFQTFGLFPWLTVLENVALGLEAQGVAAAERHKRALAAIDMIGLDGFESAYPKELSGGMRQRVGFARALVVAPDVLLMDEAFSALDVPTSETLRNDLLDLWLERRIPTRAILMVSHSIEEVLMIADRIVILDANPGRLKAELAVTLRHPRDPVTPAFRALTERIYTLMSSGPTTRSIGIGHRLPGSGVQQMVGLLDEIAAHDDQGAELAAAANALELEVDELFPIVEGLELFGFAQVSAGLISITAHGRAFLEADILQRKEIFAEHLVRNVPLAAHICRVIDERPQHCAPESRFLRELEDTLSSDEAERVLSVVIDWGRYAEVFAYDFDRGEFVAEDPAGVTPADSE
ncbi:nitrate/sulfonate/bicarbonate ABC transporter ATP-binding protein [Plasticicumulans acidivorans]|uniref:NitT/TauT family transport system ATP-binding protein n=1 Tax=Plasticicumulans acidivorans TaxID=886464 RepID=A0A317MS62_9GAMM|nr:nitrate/sulfonate/bicarbonate ABC transporter ATP-binding protein [Plasticicumulans acidivorans]PWV59894.1 NitT/TauT family transport system ATP-binding protein [Plasticicumulans acidivorans]